MQNTKLPRVVIVGGGFGGLYAARLLARQLVQVLLIDRRNHHTFQPLLYQVATAGLSPGEIAAPIRWILRGRRNVEVLLGEVQDFDLQRRLIKLENQDVAFGIITELGGAFEVDVDAEARRVGPRLTGPSRHGSGREHECVTAPIPPS